MEAMGNLPVTTAPGQQWQNRVLVQARGFGRITQLVSLFSLPSRYSGAGIPAAKPNRTNRL